MPPRKSNKTVNSAQPTKTLGSFFAINGTRPVSLPAKASTRSRTASSSQATQEPVSPASAIVDLDSDSDDGLLDPLAILGPRTPRALEDQETSLTRPGFCSRALPSPPALAPCTPVSAYQPRLSATPYQNNLQSLVRAQECKKYDLGFIDEQMLHISDDDDDGNDSGSATNFALLTDHDSQSALPDILKEDAERVRAQIGADIDSVRTPVRLSLFNNDARIRVAPIFTDEHANAFAAMLDGDDPVERIFSNTTDTYSPYSILRRALKSGCITVQARLGWKLTRSIGDMLLRTMCLEPDRCVAHRAWVTLQTCIELRLPTWELQLDTFFVLLEELQGKLCSRAKDEKTSTDSLACRSDLSSASSPLSVYVDTVVPKHSHNARVSAERVAFLLDIASRSLDLLTAADCCRTITSFVASLLDHGNCLYRDRMQQSLASLLDRVTPASKWSLAWGELVAELGRLLGHLQIQTQLGVVEQLPSSNKRCMQLRRSLSFLFLRKQTLDGTEGDASLDSLARTATLPSQIALRVVSEMMLDGGLPFQVGSSVDYSQLEAAVGLLSNILDSVQAMHDVRDVSRSIYQRLCVINQRISDGVADNIDKTLAKDAIQTLVVRLFMTAISDSAERLSPVYSSARPLDNWLNIT